jgi:predicted DNA binding CopG/RHH family protein
MRKKVPEEEKKKSITLTINPHINELLEKHLKEKGINKSKFIETILEKELKK